MGEGVLQPIRQESEGEEGGEGSKEEPLVLMEVMGWWCCWCCFVDVLAGYFLPCDWECFGRYACFRTM